MWLHLANCNLTDWLLCLEYKTEPSVAKATNYIGGNNWGGEKHILGGGVPYTPHTLLNSGGHI